MGSPLRLQAETSWAELTERPRGRDCHLLHTLSSFPPFILCPPNVYPWVTLRFVSVPRWPSIFFKHDCRLMLGSVLLGTEEHCTFVFFCSAPRRVQTQRWNLGCIPHALSSPPHVNVSKLSSAASQFSHWNDLVTDGRAAGLVLRLCDGQARWFMADQGPIGRQPSWFITLAELLQMASPS